MRERAYLAGFLLIAGLLIFLGHDEIQKSVVLSLGLTFGGTTTAAVLALVLYRLRGALRQSRHELARKEAELEFARSVQQALFPRELPARGGLEFSAICIPASGISGDYYDVLYLPNGKIIFAIADISGKGISAAILMANLQALLRVVASGGEDPTQVCSRLNRHLHQVTDAARFATLFYAEWDPDAALLQYVNAGHNPPYLFNRCGIELLKTGGVPIGIFPDWRYEAGTVRLEAGDLLVLYSDGITEAGVRSGKEYGEKRFRSTIESMKSLPLEVIRGRVIADIQRWSREEIEDDITLFMVRVTGAAMESAARQAAGEK
jgi:phosphoserine phosphatase RsbU/P